MTSKNEEVRQHCSNAVQRMLLRGTRQHAHLAASLSHHAAPAGPSPSRHAAATLPSPPRERYAGTRPPRIAATSAAALVGEVGGRAQPPAWAAPQRSGLLSHPSVDAPLHLGQQLELGEEMGGLAAADYSRLAQQATPIHRPSAEVVEALWRDEEAAARSCFVLTLDKMHHRRRISPGPPPVMTPYEAAKEQRRAYHRQQATLRYESTIPRRRVLDPYLHLTGAQADISLSVPNTYTADRLVQREGGRWVLDNPHRQQLWRREPVMTQIMRGDFYGEGASRRCPGAHPTSNIVQKNKRDVRVASAVNRAERLARLASGR